MPGRYRVPDICIVSRDQPVEPVFTSPPLVCIEILSKDDSLRSMQARVDDYLNLSHFRWPKAAIAETSKNLPFRLGALLKNLQYKYLGLRTADIAHHTGRNRGKRNRGMRNVTWSV